MGQDTYGYDRRGYDVRLTDDPASNSAQVLDYPLDVRVDPQWPGLTGSSRLRLRPDAVADLADRLKAQAASASGLPDRLARATGDVRFGPSSWQEANHLADACGQVRAAVQTYLHGLLTHLSDAGRLLDECNRAYADAEQANAAVVRTTRSELGDGAGVGGGSATSARMR